MADVQSPRVRNCRIRMRRLTIGELLEAHAEDRAKRALLAEAAEGGQNAIVPVPESVAKPKSKAKPQPKARNWTLLVLVAMFIILFACFLYSFGSA